MVTPSSPLTRAPFACIAGRASPTTAAQIGWAEQHGFVSIALDVALLVDPATAVAAAEAHCRQAVDSLRQGASVLCYSERGPIAGQQSACLSIAFGERLR